uniref:F-box domain-containing protein n=1 Tax=Strongyloides papillosus TaxID=174720 RepID=A0A0N5BM74_STREA
MEFINLPEDFKLQIFKELQWKDINNLKLVCRDFYFIITKNIEQLDREELNCLTIYYDKNKIIKVEYRQVSNNELDINDILRSIEFNDDNEYEIFLRNRKIINIKELIFENITKGDTITIRDYEYYYFNINYDTSTTTNRAYEICLSKEYGACNACLTISSINKIIEIPYNTGTLKKELLEKMSIFKKDNYYLIISKIVLDILTNDPMLKHENISTINTNIEPIFSNLIINMHKLGFLEFENNGRCSSKELYLCYSGEHEINAEEKKFYTELFNEIKHEDQLLIIEERNFDIENFKICLECGARHINKITLEDSNNYRILELL